MNLTPHLRRTLVTTVAATAVLFGTLAPATAMQLPDDSSSTFGSTSSAKDADADAQQAATEGDSSEAEAQVRAVLEEMQRLMEELNQKLARVVR